MHSPTGGTAPVFDDSRSLYFKSWTFFIGISIHSNSRLFNEACSIYDIL